MTQFDQSAFADTVSQTRRDLEDVAAGVDWLAPVAYEKRAGGKGGIGVVCETCDGRGTYWEANTLLECNDCVVALLGDAGEIVLRRKVFADQLDLLAADAERMWKLGKGMTDRLAKIAKLIDDGSSSDERWGPPTVDHREAAEAWAAKGRRVKRGEDRPPLRGVEKEARERLNQFRRQQEAVRQAAEAKTVEREDKRRNRWVGAK